MSYGKRRKLDEIQLTGVILAMAALIFAPASSSVCVITFMEAHKGKGPSTLPGVVVLMERPCVNAPRNAQGTMEHRETTGK